MKKLLIIPLLFITVIDVFGQTQEQKKQMAIKLKKSKLMVVVDNPIPEIADKFRAAMEKHWTYCEFECITQADLPKYRDNRNLFIMGCVESIVFGTGTGYYWSIFPGGLKESQIENNRLISHTISVNRGKGGKFLSFNEDGLELALDLKDMQIDIEECISPAPKLREKKYNYFYYDAKEQLPSLTIFIHDKGKDEKVSKKFNPEKLATALGVASSQIKMVSREEIIKAVEEGREDVAYGWAWNQTIIKWAKDARTLASVLLW